MWILTFFLVSRSTNLRSYADDNYSKSRNRKKFIDLHEYYIINLSIAIDLMGALGNLVLKPIHSGITMPIRLLLMPQICVSPSHAQSSHWLIAINAFLSHIRWHSILCDIAVSSNSGKFLFLFCMRLTLRSAYDLLSRSARNQGKINSILR